jgi:hypothetical protein
VLPTPRPFAPAARLVTAEMTGSQIPCGSAAEEHAATLRAYADAGFDEVYVNQIGPDLQGFFDFYRTEVLSLLRD